MKDTEKYLIHATIAADGVVERSDVVGAVFGQTEGLLGDELDLRDLQESSRVGRIDVGVESENGQSFGEVTVASSLDKVETAILAAALETIDRIGPCHASVEVTSIEDVRAAKRREVVERAKELVAGGFEETSLASDDILDEVREAARIEGIVDYKGLPAGPRVGDSDAVIVVEGRADVLTLLECGIKNAVAVEGTNVPAAVADLTADRTVTAFLDGDRGGELILRELAQVGDVDYVAFAPPGESVEDLDRKSVFESLRGKVPYGSLAEEPNLREAAEERSGHGGVHGRSATEAAVADSADRANAPTDGDTSGADASDDTGLDDETPDSVASDAADAEDAAEAVDVADEPDGDDLVAAVENGTDAPDSETDEVVDASDRNGDASDSNGDVSDSNGDANDRLEKGDASENGSAPEGGAPSGNGSVPESGESPESDVPEDDDPRSVEEHVQEVVDAESDLARLLGDDFGVLAEVAAADAFDAIEGAEIAPHTVILDGRIDQRLLDVAAQRGVSELLGRDVGEFVKRPVGTRVLTVGDLRTGS